MKRDLSEMANEHLHELLNTSDFKNSILIGRHSLGKSSFDRNEVYGGGRDFDGIHLRGPAGQYCYTKSFMQVLSDSGLLAIKIPTPSLSFKASPPSSEIRKHKHLDDHTDCEQARYSRARARAMNNHQQSKHSPVFLKRGTINNSFYSRNIFETLNYLNNSEN